MGSPTFIGNTPKAQADSLAAAGCNEVFVDKTAGTFARRPKLDKALLSGLSLEWRHDVVLRWGGFPMRGKSLTARAMSRYFVDEGVATYTHGSDQHTTYGSKVIPVTDREAVYVLD